MNLRKLGRGLGSLMAEDETGQTEAEAILQLATNQITPNRNQPRRAFDQDKLEELAASISTHGILQPILVRRTDGDPPYEIIAGERRWRAARLAEQEKVPVILQESIDDQTNLELSLIENIQREDLNPIEKAKGYRVLLDEFSLTQEEVAVRVGQKRATIANMIRLLDLPDDIQDMVTQGALSMGHARALLALISREQQRKLARKISKDALSVRAVEKAVNALLQRQAQSTAEEAPQEAKPPHILDIEERIMEATGCKSHIRHISDSSGRLTIEFADNNDFERLLDALGVVLDS